jgi:hypothetical protein
MDFNIGRLRMAARLEIELIPWVLDWSINLFRAERTVAHCRWFAN